MPIVLETLAPEVRLSKYNGWDQTRIAADLNARTIAGDVDVSVEQIDRYMTLNGVWGRIDARAEFYRSKLAAAAINSADEQKLAAIRTMIRALERLPSLNTSTGANKSAVFLLIENLFLALDATPTAGEGVLTLQQRNALRQMATGVISRIEQMFDRGDRVTPEQVEAARRIV